MTIASPLAADTAAPQRAEIDQVEDKQKRLGQATGRHKRWEFYWINQRRDKRKGLGTVAVVRHRRGRVRKQRGKMAGGRVCVSLRVCIFKLLTD